MCMWAGFVGVASAGIMQLVVYLSFSAWLCAGVARAQLAPEWLQFEEFLTSYSKSYQDDSETLQVKFSAFQQSLQRQKQLNDYEKSHGGSAVFGVNKFSDLTTEEFKTLYLSGLLSQKGHGSTQHPHLSRDFLKSPPPNKFDWRDHSPPVVGGIRNQERCGSCWAFAVVETIGSAFAIHHNRSLVELSPQQLISCVHVFGLNGCQGGVLSEAFQYLRSSNLTVVSEKDYPFASKDGQNHTCKQPSPPIKGLVLEDYLYADNVNESFMQVLLTTVSPLTTSINALTWQDYIGGIIQHHCSGASIDHAVQVVGYDLTGVVPYWLVRNTWGADWGEHGYIRIKYGQNMCGIADEVAAVYRVSSSAV